MGAPCISVLIKLIYSEVAKSSYVNTLQLNIEVTSGKAELKIFTVSGFRVRFSILSEPRPSVSGKYTFAPETWGITIVFLLKFIIILSRRVYKTSFRCQIRQPLPHLFQSFKCALLLQLLPRIF